MAYEITEEKRQLFEVMLGLITEFSRVCKENGIKWYVFAGTMLGAIRHKGFIPWDDDVDVILFREDYEKLKKVAENGAFKEPYFFQNPKTDKGYPKCFCRLRNSQTTELPFMDFSMNCNRGIFIDIFPLDVVPDDQNEYQKQMKQLKSVRLVINSYSRYYSGLGTIGTTKIKAIAYYCSLLLFKTKILTPGRLYERIEKILSRYSDTDAKRIGAIALLFDHNRFIYPKELWEGDTIWCDFESIKVPVPERYDEILRHSYGDYMKPVQEQTNHGEILFSTTIPYSKFIEDNYEELKKQWYKYTELGKKQNNQG